MDKYPDLLSITNEEYLTNQDKQWPSHTAHFHTSLKSYIACPQTCVEELEEFVEKIRTSNK